MYGKNILIQLGGTEIPPSTPKTVEDEVFGGCFPILLLFFLVGNAFLYGISLLLHK